MPGHKRIEIAGAIYHVITRGMERRSIFMDGKDGREFVTRLEINLNPTLQGARTEASEAESFSTKKVRA